MIKTCKIKLAISIVFFLTITGIAFGQTATTFAIEVNTATVTVGTDFSVTVRAVDDDGATATTGSIEVRLGLATGATGALTSGGSSPLTVTLGGTYTHTWNDLRYDRVGTITITATDQDSSSPLTAASADIDFIGDATSTIARVDGGESATPIAYAGLQAPSNLAQGTSASLFTFEVSDAGSDGLQTEIASISCDITNYENLRTLELFVGGSSLSVEVSVTGNIVTFMRLGANIIDVPNAGNLEFNVRATFSDDVDDGEQIGLTLTATAAASGSTFETGSISTNFSSADVNAIAVTATTFNIEVSTDAVLVNDIFNVTVTAVDGNGNTDVADRDVILSELTDEGLVYPTGLDVVEAMTDGVYIWRGLRAPIAETIGIRVTDTPGTLSASEDIDVVAGVATTTSVFFSEYIQGGASNQALEIYNDLEDDVDLSEFSIARYSSGSSISSIYVLGGNLPAKEVYVIVNSGASGTLTSTTEVDLSAGFFDFDGNDAIALLQNGDIVDFIGGNDGDPGVGWDVAGVDNATADHTLVRKTNITVGNPDPLDSFGDTEDNSEWIVYNQNEFSYLGSHCTTPSTQATNVAFGVTDNTSMVITWAKGAGSNSLVVVKQGSEVDPSLVLDTNYTSATADFSAGTVTLGTDNVVVYSGNMETVTVTGLTSATTYHVAVYAYSPVGFCYNTASPVTGSNTTSGAASTITVAIAGGETASIPYLTYQIPSGLAQGTSASLFTFDINDSATGTTDGLVTIVTDISFDITNHTNLRTLALFNVDDGSSIAELNVADNIEFSTLSFSGLTITAPSGMSKQVNVRATFGERVDDGEEIGLAISAVTADASGSGFAEFHGGGAAIIGSNAMEVIATVLAITVTPDVGLTFPLTVRAVDANGNIDVAARDVTLSQTNVSTTLASATGLGPKAMINGVYTWSDLTFTSLADATLRVAGDGGLSATSAVKVRIFLTTVFFSEYVYGTTASGVGGIVEIYNGSGLDVDLSNFSITLYRTGVLSASIVYPLSGNLSPGQVHLAGYTFSGSDLSVDTEIPFNPSDAIALLHYNVKTIDFIGGITGFPTGGWSVAGTPDGTRHTLVRKQNIIDEDGNPQALNTGNPTPLDSFGTNEVDSEWIVYDQDEFRYLGSHCTQPTTQATGVAFGATGETSMVVNWVSGNGNRSLVVMKEAFPVDATVVLSTSYLATADFSTGTGVLEDNVVVYSNNNEQTVTVTGLTQGTTYHVAVYSYNDAGSCYNITSPATGFKRTASSNDEDSDITAVAGGETAVIDYLNYQLPSGLAVANSASLFTFSINDKGGDALSTTLTDISFDITNYENLRTLALFVDGSNIAALDVTGNTVAFTGLTIEALNNSSKEVNVRATFLTDVDDGAQIGLTISVAEADAALGSIFADVNGGGAATISSNQIEVTATVFAITAPELTLVNADFTLTVTAVDINDNIDVGTRQVTLSLATGMGSFTSMAAGVGPVEMSNGVYTWSDLQYDVVETITASVTDGTRSATSEDINVWALLTSVFFSEYVEGTSLYDKALEIYNGSGSAVDLDQFSISIYRKGQSTPNNTYPLSGTLNVGRTHVIGNSGAGFILSELDDVNINGVTSFEGNDAIALLHLGVIVDFIGDNNGDPGTGWSVGGVADATADRTLIRRSNVFAGNPTPLGSFTNDEWLVRDANSFTELKSHSQSSCTEPSIQATDVTFENKGTSMVVNWTRGNGDKSLVVVKAGSAVDATPVLGASYTSASTDFSVGTITLGTGNIVVYSGGSNAQTVTVTGLAPGTTYHVAVYAYNETGFCYDTITPATGSNLASIDADSDITAVVGGETASIAYGGLQTASNLAQGTSASLFTFNINDKGTTDALPTRVTAISFDITNHENLRTLALFDGPTPLKELDVATNIVTNTLTFTDLLIEATSSSKAVNVRATFSENVDDGEQIGLTISAVTVAASSSSTFATSNGGGATTDISTDDSNQIEVAATALAITAPASVPVGTPFEVVVTAVDNLGNTDIGATPSVTLSRTGTGDLTSSVGLGPLPMEDGVYTWSDLQYDVVETITASVTDGTRSATSDPINVFELLTTVFFSEYVNATVPNQALEIYNGSGSAVDLDQFSISKYDEGASTVSSTYRLSGSLTAGEVYVIGRPGAGATISFESDVTDAIISFDGNDAMALLHNEVIVDIIGSNNGVDPGFGWPVAGTTDGTRSHTLVRKPGITEGNPDPLGSFGDTEDNSEWIVYDLNELSYLGRHIQCTIPSQATSVVFGAPDQTSMVVNWTKGDGNKSLVVVKEGSAVDATPVLGTGYLLATTDFSAAAATLTTGNVVVYSGDSDPQTVTVTGLTSGVTYHVAVYAYNADRSCYNTASPARSSQATATAPDETSTITRVGGETASIEYDIFQATASDLDVDNSASLFTFEINDSDTGTDGYSTTLTAISFDITNYENLIRLALFDVGDDRNLAELDVTGSTVAFTGLTIEALDRSSKAVNVRATFAADVDDGEQIGLTISAVTAAASSSSTFATGDGGGATTISSNQIEVAATVLAITEVPVDAVIGTDFTVTVKAVDALGNTDLNAVPEVTLASTTGTGLTSSVGLVKALENGVYMWNDLQYDAAEVIMITAAGGGLTAVTSESISVTATAVTATRFTIEVPDNVVKGTPFSVTVTAVDVDGATATDATAGTAVTLSHSGSGALTSSRSSLTATLANGVYRWDDLQYNAEEVIMITVAGGTLTEATSDPINVFPLLNTVFFSEYIQGSDFNRALEIYNGSGGDVNLAEFSISLWTNGSATARTFDLTDPSGTDRNLVAGDVYVLGHSRANLLGISSQTDIESDATDFNGNDGIALLHNGVIVDIIGDNAGTDPVSGWLVAGTANATAAHTLVRKQSITQGNDTGNDAAGGSFGTTIDNSEWIVYATDEFRYLGTHCNLPSTQATNVIFGITDETSMVVNWTKGDGNNSLVVVKAASAVDETPTWNADYTAATTDFSAPSETLGTGNVVVYSGDLATVTVTGLTSGVTYHVAVYSYNADRFCYNTASPARSSQATTTAPDTDSHITASSGETASIAYNTFQEVVGSLDDRNSASLFTFDINDIGTDGYPTTLTAISFEITNYENLIRLALFDVDDNRNLAALDVTGSTVAFTGLTIVAASNMIKAVNVRATFSNNVDDGEQIGLTITSVTAAATGSTFAAGDGGRAATDPTLNAIAVTASKLDITDPGTARINENFDLTVKAVDNLGNTDVDAETDVTLGLASGATGALNLVGSGLMARLSGGTHTYDLQYNRAEIIRITVEDDASTLTSFTSENINIVTTLPVFTVVASSPIAFGPVDNRANSASKSFTVEGTNLTHAIEVTATNGFEVSLIMDSGFGTSVELTKETDGTLTDGTVTVYVRFSPISGTNGDVNSNIALNTSGAVAEQTIPVTGTETGNPPAFIVVASSPIAFGPVDHGANSASQSFTVEGTNLTANIEVEVQANARANGFEVSLIMDSGFGSSVDIAASGTLRSTPVYVRFSPNSGINGDVTGDILLTTEGAVEQTVSVMGTEAGNPAFTVTDTPLNDFGNVNHGANSGSQMFTVSGENLTDNITVTAKDGFQVSLTTEDSGFATTVDLTPDAATGAVTSTPVHVRFSPTSGTSSDVTSEITLSTAGAENQTVEVTGTETAVTVSGPSFTVTKTILGFGPVNDGANSPSQSFDVSGSDLTANITVTATDGFEVSLDDSDFSGPVDLIPDGSGTLTPTPVHVRFSPTSGTGDVNSDIVLSTTGGPANQTVSVSGTVVVVVSKDATSTITRVGGETASIAYGGLQETTLTKGNSASLFTFEINDTGTADGLRTILSDISFEITNYENLRALALFDVDDNLAQLVVTASTVAFTGLTIVASSGTSKAVNVRATFSENVDDGEQIGLTISVATAAALDSSTFEEANGGGAATISSNQIEVTATELAITAPEVAQLSTAFEVVVTAVDDLGNTDVADRTVTLARTKGTGVLVSATGLGSKAMMNGVYRWSDLVHPMVEIITVTVTDNTATGALSAIPSGDINIVTTLPTITVTGVLNGFGTVDHASTSAVQSFNVVGSDLLENITVKAPDGFQVSLEAAANFMSSVALIHSSGAVTLTPVHVRFAPNSGINGDVTGDIELKTTGVEQTVSVMGTEAGNLPSFTVVASPPIAFGDVNKGANSDSQSFTVEGKNLTANITVTATDGFEVSLDNITFATTVDLVQAGGALTGGALTGGTVTVHVRFSPESDTNSSVTSDIVLSTTGGPANQTVSVTGTQTAATVSGPSITVTEALTDFGLVDHGQTSDVQEFAVSGTDLTADITVEVEATSGFEVSLEAAASFGSSIALVHSSGAVDATVYVRFAPESGVNGQVTRDITLSTTGAAVQTVSVMGTEAGNVSFITVTGTLDDFGSVNHGETSESQSFDVEGASLTSDITITAPGGFQISLDNSNFSASVDLTPDAATGVVTSTTVHVRFAPTSGTGEVTGDIVLSATDADNQTISVVGTAIAVLTGIGQESLKYNISVYPNPSEEVLHITIPESFGTGEVKLVSLDGTVVQKGSIGKMKQIETSNLRKGIYLLQVLNATTVVNYRVVVK